MLALERIRLRFSIVIPVYNIKDYLPRCVESLLAQSVEPYEILLIDDGSKLGDGPVCDELADRYELVKAYHKENGGAADTRNYGASLVTGDYLVFIDGDDWVDEDMLLSFKKAIEANPKAEPVDVVMSEGFIYNIDDKEEENKWFEKEYVSYISGQETLLYTSKHFPNWSPVSKCYRKKYWDDHGFKFVKGRLAEDFQLVDRVVFEAENVVMVPSFYHYFYRSQSSVRSVNEKFVLDSLTNLEDWKAYLQEHECIALLKDQLRALHANLYSHSVFAYLYLVESSNRKAMIDRAYELRDYIKYIPGKEGTIIRLSTKLIGFKNTSKLLGKLKKKRLAENHF